MKSEAIRKEGKGMTAATGLKRPARNVFGLFLATALLATGGCAAYNQDQMAVGSIPDDYRTRHPIIVSESEKTRDILIPASVSRLDQRGKDIVRDFGYQFKSSGARQIAILLPTGAANEHAAGKAAQDAVAELRALDIPLSRIRVQHYNASSHGQSAAMRLVYKDLEAAVSSQCGDWGEDITNTSQNRNYRNFGCATQNNLAQMVANPSDLLGPRGVDEIDSTKRTNVINDWRENASSLTLD